MASVATAAKARGQQGLQSLPVQSGFIALVEYDEANLTLTTHLRSGAIYQHKFFLPQEWVALKTSQDPAKHWSDNVTGKKASVRLKSAKAPKSELKHKGRK